MKLFKNVISCLTAVVLLVSLLPAALAAPGDPMDNDSILTDLGHSATNTAHGIGDSRDITLKVPFAYSGTTIDLNVGLNTTYDTSLYKTVVASCSTASIDGAAVPLVISYNCTSDTTYDGLPKYKTTYNVKVIRDAAVPAVFSGAVTASVKVGTPASFTTLGVAGKYVTNDGPALSAISVTGSTPAFGTLKFKGATYTSGTKVNASELNQLIFQATTGGTVSYTVAAFAGTDTEHPYGTIVLTITADDSPEITAPIVKNVGKDAVVNFTLADFTNTMNLGGHPLISIALTLPPAPASPAVPAGTWKYIKNNTPTPLNPNTTTTITAAEIPTLTFTATVTGTGNVVYPATENFSWTATTSAGTVTAPSGNSITVTSTTLTLSNYSSGPILKGGTWPVSQSNFAYSPASAPLAYIQITTPPNTADGTLCLTKELPNSDTYGYPRIAANTALPTKAVIPASYLGYLQLVTKNTSTAAAVTFSWSATTDLKVSTATWATPSTYTVSFVALDDTSLTTDMNTPVSFSSTAALNGSSVAAYINSVFTTRSGRPLSYVTFTLPDAKVGTLYLDYDLTAKKGTAVTAAALYYTNKSPNLAGITFIPAADFTGTATVTYKAYADANTYVTGKLIFYVQNSPGGTVALQTDKNSALQLDASTVSAAFKAATGKSLNYVTLSIPSTSYGALYYDLTSAGHYSSPVSSGSAYYVYSSPYLSLVSFVPANDFTGTVPIYFTGYASDGSSYSGKLVITVVDSPAGIVSYNLAENGYVKLSGGDFSNEFVSVSGSILSYVNITPPPATSGTLYYQYDASKKTGTAVGASIKYYDGNNPDISDITFVPAKDFVGTAVVAYKAYNASGTAFAGKLKFTVNENSQLISYNVTGGQRVSFNAGDFLGAFSLLSGGKILSHVTFDLPSASSGRLYYNYYSSSNYDSAVAAGNKYYLAASPLISGVSFVPADSFSGSVTISYTGTSMEGASFTGKIRITVTGTAASGSVNYTTNSLTPVTFSAADFVAAYPAASGALSYVTFALPYSSYGTLYYNYSSTVSSNTPISASTAYYVNNQYYYQSISNITFVPNSGFSGSLAIGYTAYNTSGVASPGTVVINVKSSSIDTVTYSTMVNTPVLFNASDLNSVFMNKTGSSLNYVMFTLPTTDQGQLFLGYNSPNAYTSAVSSGTRYYVSYSPLLSDVSFVPRAGFTGTVTINYVGYTAAGGTGYSGKLIISVGTAAPFDDMKSGYDWAADAVSYLYSKGVVKGSGGGKFNPGDYVTRADFILMLTRAFGLTSSSTDNFSDVPMGTYYYSAIAAAKYHGIIAGTNGKFYPTGNAIRQDAMLMLTRALDFKGISLAPGTTSDLSAFSDASQVSDYAVPAMASLVKAGVITGSNGKLNPKSPITRAEMAVILYKALTI